MLVVGASHRSAPVDVLERLALGAAEASKLASALQETPHVGEVAIVATCNRVEVYVDVDRFHGSVDDVTSALAAHAGLERDIAVKHLYVHYDDAAVAHLFAVASGLDSMLVGETQILGQVRNALQRGQDDGTVGPALNALFQQALRVGKRGHAETGIDRAGTSLISTALDHAEQLGIPVAGSRVLVLGAGAMAALSVATAARRGAAEVVVVNRTPHRASRLAEAVEGRSADWADLDAELGAADLVVSCTGATGTVISADLLARARAGVEFSACVVLDLALPRDVEARAASVRGIELLDLSTLAAVLADTETTADVRAVRAIVSAEVAAFLAARSASRVTPTVVALRTMATDVVDAEVARLRARVPDLPEQVVEELARSVRRVADKLLHEPTVRIKELAARPGGVSYADALSDLFSLEQSTIDAVTRVGDDLADDLAAGSDPGARR